MENTIQDFRELFIKTLLGNIHLIEFRDFLYPRTSELIEEYGEEFVLELIDVDYSSKYSMVDLHDFYDRHFDINEVHTYKVLKTLRDVLAVRGDKYKMLKELHSLYVRGYKFLEDVALYFAKYSYWPEREDLYRMPFVDNKITEYINLIETGAIEIIQSEEGPLYVDHRNESLG